MRLINTVENSGMDVYLHVSASAVSYATTNLSFHYILYLRFAYAKTFLASSCCNFFHTFSLLYIHDFFLIKSFAQRHTVYFLEIISIVRSEPYPAACKPTVYS